MSQNQTQVSITDIVRAKHAGIAGAWKGLVNPWKREHFPELWKAWNDGRKMAASSAPGLDSGWIWYNSYMFEGRLKADGVEFPFDGLGLQML